jgi:transposase InsO family protein
VVAGIPERTYRRRLARLRHGQLAKGPWPAPVVDHMEALAAKYAETWPAWGYRKIAALMRADGHQVTNSSVARALRRRGLLLPQGFRADRKSWAVLRRLLNLDDLRTDRGVMDIVDAAENVIGRAPAPIAVVSDNGPCFRGQTFRTAFDGDDPLLRHVRTRVKSPQTNGVVERYFGTLKYEHLYRGYIGDGDALDMEVHRFRIIYNTIRPHQALNDRTPQQAYLDHKTLPTS